MGKKPLVGIVGLFMAGIALTGCDCCKRERQYTPGPTFQLKGNPPAPVAGGAAPDGFSQPIPNIGVGGPPSPTSPPAVPAAAPMFGSPPVREVPSRQPAN